MSEELVELEVSVRMTDIKKALDDSEDLAWEHAKEFAEQEKIKLGSEEFADAYSILRDRYTHQVEHLKFFMLSAMLNVRQLLEAGILMVPSTDGEKPDERHVAQAISEASLLLTTSSMWLAAGYEFSWPVNTELPEELVVKYHLRADDVREEKELDNDL